MGRHLKQLEWKNIRITDSLFGAYVRRVTEKIIPHQWKILNDQLEDAEPTWCIHNFRVAAGEAQGERMGVVFQDTDLYKWLETVAYCLAAGQGREYESLADMVIALMGRAQEADGYLNTYFTVNAPDRKWKNLVEGHELYTAGHMIEAAVAYYGATGKRAILDIAQKNADLICRIFGPEPEQIHGYPGHQEIELALVKLYRTTGERRYLERARYFIEERGKEPNYLTEEMRRRGGVEFFSEFNGYDLEYAQAHMQPVRQRKAEGHAVRMMYMCAAMADLAEEYDDAELLEACRSIWNNAVHERMYITGGIGSSGFRECFTTDYDLPNSTNYSETCASIGLMMFGQRMASATGEAAYYDEVERALYNTVLAGTNIEGDRYFYVNPLEVVPEFCTRHTYMDHVKPTRQKWFGVACCPPNIARTLASLGQYIYAQDDQALYIHQFISSEAKAEIGGSRLELCMESSLLQDGRVVIDVCSSGAAAVRIRIPSYAGAWRITVSTKGENGDDVRMMTREKMETVRGYGAFALAQGQHHIELDFDIHAKWMGADDRVREDAGKAALVKGPVVYCLEEADNGELLSQVCVEPNAAVREESPAKGLVGDLPTLVYGGLRVSSQMAQGRLYDALDVKKREVTLRAVPYCQWNNRGVGEMMIWQKLRV